MSTDDNPAIIAQLEEQAEAQVRLRMASGGYPTQLNYTIYKWLAKKDQESRERNDASQASQMRTKL